MPTFPSNPLARGFLSFRYERQLQILYDSYCEPCYRALHPSQQHLPDEQLSRCRCGFNDDVALVTGEHCVDPELMAQYTDTGTLTAVVYSLMADHFGQAMHLGDLPTEEAVKALVEQLSFTTGHYSRSWEISSAHLPRGEFQQLEERVWRGTPAGFFECFELVDSHTVGCKLFSTPWLRDPPPRSTTNVLAEVAARLQDDGVPPVLASLLLLAGQADVRWLLFDPDAAPMAELPLYLDH